jgi:FkbM family methyltransferase
MTVLHRLRQLALRAGLDVQRAEETGAARTARFLRDYKVDYVLDVGAGRGQYAGALRRFGYTGRIQSFEPVPSTYQELIRAAAGDPEWWTCRLALGAEDGRASMNIAGNVAAASSSLLPILPRHRVAQPDAAYVGRIDVAVRRLDSIWRERVPDSVTPFIKLDVQGSEGAVLDGGRVSLQHVIGLQIEMSLVPLYEGAPTMLELLERAEDLGMRMVHLEPGFADPRSGDLLQVDGIFFRARAE